MYQDGQIDFFNSELNNYYDFYLVCNGLEHKVIKGPGNWNENGLEIIRHENLHGVYTRFSNSLKFYDEAEEFIENCFKISGINTNLYLIRKNINNKKNILNDYIGLADWSTKDIDEDGLSIRFNSDDLLKIIESYNNDNFEIETNLSVNNKELNKLVLNKVDIEGRLTYSFGESVLNEENFFENTNYQKINIQSTELNGQALLFGYATSISKLLSKNDERHSSTDENIVDLTNNFSTIPSHMFFQNNEDDLTISELNINYSLNFSFRNTSLTITENDTFKILFIIFEYIENNNGQFIYQQLQEIEIFSENTTIDYKNRNINGEINISLQNNHGCALIYKGNQAITEEVELKLFNENLKINLFKSFEESKNLNFLFIDNVFERLLNIITGKKNIFYSKVLGRKEDGYKEDGEFGLIGLINGYWLRNFNQSNNKYKSISISIRDLLESCNCVFNTGATIFRDRLNQEKLRVEKLEFFYQNKTVVELLGNVYSYKEKIDDSLFFSSIEVGFEKGGEYENEVGLDEPNVKNTYVTSLNRTENTYEKISKIRADETEMEITRRKPFFNFPNEDTEGDEDLWFIDLKRKYPGKFEQINWDDRLEELPKNIGYPSNFKSFLFSPFNILLRHSWIIRSGLENNLDEYISFASSNSNSNLITKFINKEEFQENLPNKLINSKLQKSRFIPNLITIKYKLSNEEFNLINGYTEIELNGEKELIPNVYFKMKFKDKKGNFRKGYLLSLKPGQESELTFQEAEN